MAVFDQSTSGTKVGCDPYAVKRIIAESFSYGLYGAGLKAAVVGTEKKREAATQYYEAPAGSTTPGIRQAKTA